MATRSQTIGPASTLTAAQVAATQSLVSGGGNYYPAANQFGTSGIVAARQAAIDAGGGTVWLPATDSMTLTAPIQLASGVIFRGNATAFDANYNSIPAATRLLGDGTFPCFQHNQTDLGTPPTDYAAFQAAMVKGAGVMDLVMDNFSHAIKCGGLYNPGAQFSEFKNLYSRRCGVGFWYENLIYCRIEEHLIQNFGTWAFAFGGSGGVALNNGVSTIKKVFSQDSTTTKPRGFVLFARGATNTGLNAMTVENVNTILPRATVTQAATMANTSADVALASAANFAVDMPVTVSASVNGFTAGQIYFVISKVANTVQLSDTIGGTAKTATGATAVNLITNGFANVEVVAYGGSTIQPGTLTQMDCEGGATANLILQNAQSVNVVLGYSEAAYRNVAVVARNAKFCNVRAGQDYANTGMDFDIDANSKTTTIEGPRSYPYGRNSSGYSALGLQALSGSDTRYKTDTGMLALSGQYGPDVAINKNSGCMEFGNAGLAIPSTPIASGATMANKSCYVYTGAGGGSVTLPTIVANGEGVMIRIVNPSAGTLTVNTAASQTINGTGTSFSMAANSSAELIACNNGGTLFWSKL